MLFCCDAPNWFHILFSGSGGKDATYGFLRRVEVLKEKYKADQVICAFDHANLWRREIYPEYKAGRKTKDPALVEELAGLPDALQKQGIATSLCVDGYEADDILGTVASLCVDQKRKVVLASSDKDIRQCLYPGLVTILKRIVINYGEPDPTWITYDSHLQEMGSTADRWPGYLAMVGDDVDNIPGIEGIGDKTARTILFHHHIDKILEDPYLAPVSPRLRDRLFAFKKDANFILRLVTLYTAVPGVKELLDGGADVKAG